MDMQEYYGKLQGLLEDASLKIAQKATVPAANEMLAEVKNRIVRDGKKSDDSEIGNYSTKSAYFGREAFDKKSSFKPQGKGNKPKADRKTMYLPQGYKQLRDIQGKPSDKVSVNYTGSTMNAYQQQATETEVVQGFTTQQASKVRKGQEAKRGTIYSPTQQELQQYKDNVVENTKELIKQAFG